ncbi:heterokaryon incompatibility protein-domain-containing protein [Paraphoma chrysanthemicola]|uniref:Heterokaryon incompatibility protein-domain-containing protein n=1 Tax=Paraphoma chrysanthemicola TaxID=798071 RepID=A0A8K0RKM6_9PLEO|nr:heterokaryon incompatibility protein-domain-containing protein [Paraphoma chrysanthemicola]
MQFDYCRSMEKWTPARFENDAKIRILELQSPPWYARSLSKLLLFLELRPIPWYLRWLPRCLAYVVPLRTTLSWAPLLKVASDRGSISDASLASASKHFPSYKALSYTWGDGIDTREIQVNGSKHTITRSLALALLHLRPTTGRLTLWIDQICINQLDNIEKSEQVKMMDRLYRNADEGLVWLGSAADRSDALFDVLNKMGEFASAFNLLGYYTKDKYHELPPIQQRLNPKDPKTIEYHEFCDSMMHEFTHTFFNSLDRLFRRPWFYRAWTIQEYALPPKVTLVCGSKAIGAETLMVVLQMILSTIVGRLIRDSFEDHDLIALLETIQERNTLQPFQSSRQRRKACDEGRIAGEGLYQVLKKVHIQQSLKATQGCDMIYGVLGLANDVQDLGITADYSIDDHQLQAVSTYTHTAKMIIGSGKVDLLTFAQHKQKDMNLPSWVPDWRAEIARSFAWLRDENEEPVFRASNGQPVELREMDDEKVLALTGYLVDIVEEVGGPWAGESRVGKVAEISPFEDYITFISQVRHLCLLSKSKGTNIYPTSARRDEAIWRIPVADLEQDESYLPVRASTACKLGYDQCTALLDLQIQLPSFATSEERRTREAEVISMAGTKAQNGQAPGQLGSLYRIRMQALKGKRPFLSKIGYVGLGPSYMRSGDMIVVLSGGTIPFIIRPVDEGKYRLMGECYCDGIMDGEIVTQRAKEEIVLV